MARLIIRASANTQVWVVTHASRLIAALSEGPDCRSIQLEKNFGQTELIGRDLIDEPLWYWAD